MKKKLKGTFCGDCGADIIEPTKEKQSRMISEHERGGIFYGWGYRCLECSRKESKVQK